MSVPLMKSARLLWQRLDKRVLWLLALAALTAAIELGLRSWEAHQKVESELKTVRGRIELLHSSADHIDWTQRSIELAAAHESLQSRLWHSPSEAQAQAMLRDWLSTTLKGADLRRVNISLQTVQQSNAAPSATQNETKPTPPATAEGTGQRLAKQAIRVRAAVSFDLIPNAFETALQRIERSGQLANVDNVSVSRRSRKVDMTVSVPVIIGDDVQASTGARP